MGAYWSMCSSTADTGTIDIDDFYMDNTQSPGRGLQCTHVFREHQVRIAGADGLVGHFHRSHFQEGLPELPRNRHMFT